MAACKSTLGSAYYFLLICVGALNDHHQADKLLIQSLYLELYTAMKRKSMLCIAVCEYTRQIGGALAKNSRVVRRDQVPPSSFRSPTHLGIDISKNNQFTIQIGSTDLHKLAKLHPFLTTTVPTPLF